LLDRSHKMLSRNVCSIYQKCRGTDYFRNKATFSQKHPPVRAIPNLTPLTLFIGKLNWFYLLCCTGLKKCCPEMYVAYTQCVEEQSISGIKLLFIKTTSPQACNSQNNYVFCLNLFSLTKRFGHIGFARQVSKNAVQKCM
jgi:hypothetical protein